MLERYRAAKALILEAGQLALDFQRQVLAGQLNIEAKGVQDFVTEADQKVEQFLKQQLQRRFAEDGFFGEESDQEIRQGQGFWVVDPIDGTSNYMRGLDQWCVAVAYVSEGQTQLGLVYDPVRELLYHAGRGEGAFINDRPVSLATERPDDPLLILGHSRRAPLSCYLNSLEYLYGKGVEHRKLGSAALGLVQPLSGLADGYFEADLNPWDCLAGLLIVEQAGGVVCAGNDMASTLANGPVAAGCQALVEELSALAEGC